MSLKAIEMQVALPRTQDAGRVQEQLNQRNVVEQHQIQQEQKQKAELERKKSTKMEGSISRMIQDEEASSQSRDQSSKKRKEKKKEEVSPHPYKGKHIDISL